MSNIRTAEMFHVEASKPLAAPGLLTTNPVNSVEKLILYFVPSEIPLPKVLELAIKSLI